MSNPLTREELRELVRFDSDTHDKDCGVTKTHDLGNCDCSKDELIDTLMSLFDTYSTQDEAATTQLINERDKAEEWADILTDDISKMLGIEFGEHSNVNEPWRNAHWACIDATPPKQPTNGQLNHGEK